MFSPLYTLNGRIVMNWWAYVVPASLFSGGAPAVVCLVLMGNVFQDFPDFNVIRTAPFMMLKVSIDETGTTSHRIIPPILFITFYISAFSRFCA